VLAGGAMTPWTFVTVGLNPGLSLLPARMDTPAARAMILAIALQESNLEHRRQRGDGPARGYPQFEQIGCSGVLMHPASRFYALEVCKALDVHPTAPEVWRALEHNDALAVAFSRLLLWADPERLPDEHNFEAGWRIYLRTWRPGKPRPEKWRGYFGVAYSVVQP
jgi:hypothetical protein